MSLKKYIAALDYQHLDNGVFLTSLARSISQQEDTMPILIHGDSAYTERVMQTGVMRDEAKIRSIKDLNHRLIALFADEGVSAVGLHGFQHKLITEKDKTLKVDRSFFDKLPEGPMLVLSTLVWDKDHQSVHALPLNRMVSYLRKALNVPLVYAFSSDEKDEIIIEEKPDKLRWQHLPPGFAAHNLPDEFVDFDEPLHLTTARAFHKISPKNTGIKIY